MVFPGSRSAQAAWALSQLPSSGTGAFVLLFPQASYSRAQAVRGTRGWALLCQLAPRLGTAGAVEPACLWRGDVAFGSQVLGRALTLLALVLMLS